MQLSITEAAEKAGCSRQIIERLIIAKKLRALNFGTSLRRIWRIEQSDLEKLLVGEVAQPEVCQPDVAQLAATAAARKLSELSKPTATLTVTTPKEMTPMQSATVATPAEMTRPTVAKPAWLRT